MLTALLPPLASEASLSGLLVVLLIILAVIIAFVIAVTSADNPITQVLRQVAVHTGGTVQGQTLHFMIGDRRATIDFPGSKPGRTRVVLDVWGRSPGTFHIVPAGFGRAFLKMLGDQDLRTGDPAFDAAFIVKAMPEATAAKLFSPEARRQTIGSFNRIRGHSHPTIDLDPYCLTVQVRESLLSEGDLIALVKTVQEFSDYLIGAIPSGDIQFGEMRTSSDSACPVCGSPLLHDIVHCEACRTPHHLQCWDYMGRCSTYACKGKRSVA